MTQLQKYEPLSEITLYDGRILYTPQANYNGIKKALNTQKFIEVNGQLFNVSLVKSLTPVATQGSLEIADMIKSCDPTHTSLLKDRIKEFQRSTGRTPPVEVVNKWIEKLRNGGRLTH